MIKKIFQKIPKLPLSALIFYLSILALWKIGWIPAPGDVLEFLKSLFESYGLLGLFIAVFLEGIVYLGLYFPGSFVIALAVIFSDGTFKSFFIISMIVALALTITSVINYFLGRKLSINYHEEKGDIIKKRIFSKGLIISMLHPNTLAFYFFNSGLKKQNFLKIGIVPLIMIPYGLVLGYLLYSIKEPLKKAIENPYVMITIIFVWILIAFFVENRNKSKRAKTEQG